MLTQVPATKQGSSVLCLQPLACVQPLTSQIPTESMFGDQQCLVLAKTWTAFFGQLCSAPLDACKNPCLKVFNWNHSFPVSRF